MRFRRFQSLAAMLLLSAFGAVAPAHAQDAAGGPPVVESLRLIGVEHVNEDRLRAVLATQESSWLPWGTPQYLDLDELAMDLKRIVAFYRDHGFPNAQIVSHDVDLREQEAEAIVTIRVQEGTPLLVGAIELEGFDDLPEDRRAELRNEIPVTVGEPVVYQEVLTGGELAARVLKNHGYPYAEVRVFQQRDGDAVTVRYEADPGPLAYFGEIEVSGHASVDDAVIRRKLTYRPGERFSQARLMESQRQLYGLNLFQFANIEVLEDDPPLSEVRTRVTVAEGNHRRVQFSAGYGTEEKLRGEIHWQHANFYGGARTLGLLGRWSALNRGGQMDFVQPYLFHPRLTLALDGHSWFTDEPAFTVHANGGSAAVNGRIDEQTRWTGVVTAEYQSSQIAEEALNDATFFDELIALGLDPVTGEQDGVLVSLGASGQRNTTDSPLDPREGYHVAAQLEQAGGWLPGTYNFLNALVEGRTYWPLGERMVVAGRLRAATISPFGPVSDVPFFKRYFLGGSTSLRGWGRFEVAPLSPAGLPVGGHSMLESALELRARFAENFGAVAFVDAGNVWSDNWEFGLGDLLYDAGAGLRYYTPIGPVRLDAAWQLTPTDTLQIDGEPQDRRWRIHVSIGQAF